MKNKQNIMPTVVLSVICLVVALVLAVVNMFTDPKIKEAQAEKEQQTLQEVMENGKNFKKIDTADFELANCITEVYSEDNGGYVFKAEVAGYKSGLVIMVGVNSDGKITGTKYTQSSETNGAENKLDGAYDGKDIDNITVETVAGSTKTSKAYYEAVNASLSAFKTIKGGNK